MTFPNLALQPADLSAVDDHDVGEVGVRPDALVVVVVDPAGRRRQGGRCRRHRNCSRLSQPLILLALPKFATAIYSFPLSSSFEEAPTRFLTDAPKQLSSFRTFSFDVESLSFKVRNPNN